MRAVVSLHCRSPPLGRGADSRFCTSLKFCSDPQNAFGMTSRTISCTYWSTSCSEQANSASFGLLRACSFACVWPCGMTSEVCEMSTESSPRETWVRISPLSSCGEAM